MSNQLFPGIAQAAPAAYNRRQIPAGFSGGRRENAMEARNSRKKPAIQLRYYELPEHEPALALMGEEWLRVYGTEPEDLHFHNLMELGLCQWGEGTLLIDGQDYSYREGVITVIPANCLHTTISKDQSLNQWEYLFVEPEQILHRAFPGDPLFVEETVRRLSRGAGCLTGPEAQPLDRLMRLALEEYRTRQPYHTELVQQLLAGLLLLAARLFDADQEPVQTVSAGLRQILPAIEYISRYYMNAVTIQEMAAQCSLSEAHLRRKFREYLNMSPNEFLTAVRIRHGCDLLNTTSYSMQEVALRVGYQSVSSFDRNFQRLMGTSPYHYKKNSKDYKGKLLEYKISAKKGWKTRQDV